MIMLQVSVRKRLKYFDLDIAFTCPEKKRLVLIGPSGAGKTTLIRMIAGLEKPDEGRIAFGDEVWFDSLQGIHLPPQKRGLGYVFQEYSLFPHLNLYQNAAFAAAEGKIVDDLLNLFGIAHLRNRRPPMVSGGERQRCAICQALARRPRLLLLDEPFSALDALTRRKLREEIRNLKKIFSFPIIYVTHDLNEAFFLADELISVVEGKIDKDWLKRTIQVESASPLPEPTVRLLRPTLAACLNKP